MNWRNNDAYREGVRLLRKVFTLTKRLGRKEEFGEDLAPVRQMLLPVV